MAPDLLMGVSVDGGVNLKERHERAAHCKGEIVLA